MVAIPPPSKKLVGSIYAALIGIVLLLFFLVISPFIESFTWAVIAVLMTWPLFSRLQRRVSTTAAALIMTILFLGTLVLAVVPITLQLSREASDALKTAPIHTEDLAQVAGRVPIVGPQLQTFLLERSEHSSNLMTHLVTFREPLTKFLVTAVQGVIQTLFTLFVAVFISFFLFRNGPELYEQFRSVVLFVGGASFGDLLQTAQYTVRGTVYGALTTALVQGMLAGVGFLVAGAPMPVLLGFATMIFSFIPFGAPLIYLPTAVYLGLVTGPWWAGLGLAIWGIAVVSSADNILRPLFISQATSMSVALVFVGVLGGVLSFGLLGLFLGPVLVAVVRGIWLDFVRSIPRTS